MNQVRELPRLLLSLARNPIEAMRTPMRFSWSLAVGIQAATAMVSGALAGIFTRSIWDLFVGILVFPLTSVLGGLIFSIFIYQFFAMFRSTVLDFRHLHSIVVIATIPYYILHITSDWMPPIDLLGFALTSLLMIVGLVEQLALERKAVIRVLLGIYVVFFLAWMTALLTSQSDAGASEAAHATLSGT